MTEYDPDEIVSQYMMDNDGGWLSPAELSYSRRQLAEMAEGDLVMDVGSGNGELAATIADINPEYDVLAADLSEGAVETASERLSGYENAHVAKGYGTEFVPDESFDTIYAVNIIQATEDPEEFLQLSYDALQEGGKMVLTSPGKESLRLWPEEARVGGEDDLPGIETPASINGHDVTYGQYVIPGEWMSDVAQDIGFEIDGEESGEIPINPKGIPNMVDVIEEGYEPQVPEKLMAGLRKAPDQTVSKLLETGDIPKVNQYVLVK